MTTLATIVGYVVLGAWALWVLGWFLRVTARWLHRRFGKRALEEER